MAGGTGNPSRGVGKLCQPCTVLLRKPKQKSKKDQNAGNKTLIDIIFTLEAVCIYRVY